MVRARLSPKEKEKEGDRKCINKTSKYRRRTLKALQNILPLPPPPYHSNFQRR